MLTTDLPQTAREALEAIPRIICGMFPTPLEELKRLRETLGENCPRLFIKRDDYTGTGFGGNKLRKLDYAMAAELERGTQIIVTVGGEKSNHARVTAAVCARLGLRCILVLNKASAGNSTDSNSEKFVPASRFVYEMFGAEVKWVGSREQRESTGLKLVAELESAGEKAAYLPLGLSYPLGALGFVEAVRELVGQFYYEVGAVPDYIFHSSSSGGTQAGIVAGCRLFGAEKAKVIGVSPDDPADEIAGRVADIANGIYEKLQIQIPRIKPGEITVLDEFIGKGYGIETEASGQAAKLLARTEGIILDPIYTAKAMAALLEWVREGKFTRDDKVLFWHTGGQLAYFYAPAKNEVRGNGLYVGGK